ncbi:hypothetical protein PR048_029362 [Dryococelus australis]|uniref:Uncharacterized protein n=1 Tax=Dryococelus australis TaxID=614101 RepID=A0ABQ9GFM6_9NEOP|nr:hypothetical protein PR048_029362 [Dryococelus australis]
MGNYFISRRVCRATAIPALLACRQELRGSAPTLAARCVLSGRLFLPAAWHKWPWRRSENGDTLPALSRGRPQSDNKRKRNKRMIGGLWLAPFQTAGYILTAKCVSLFLCYHWSPYRSSVTSQDEMWYLQASLPMFQNKGKEKTKRRLSIPSGKIFHTQVCNIYYRSSPAGSLDFRKWESCRTMPLVGGFTRGSPVSPSPSFRRRSILTSITLIGFQVLAVKSRLNLFTRYRSCTSLRIVQEYRSETAAYATNSRSTCQQNVRTPFTDQSLVTCQQAIQPIRNFPKYAVASQTQGPSPEASAANWFNSLACLPHTPVLDTRSRRLPFRWSLLVFYSSELSHSFIQLQLNSRPGGLPRYLFSQTTFWKVQRTPRRAERTRTLRGSGFDSRSGHPDFGSPRFPEIAPGECWDEALTKAMADSFPSLPQSLFPVQLAPWHGSITPHRASGDEVSCSGRKLTVGGASLVSKKAILNSQLLERVSGRIARFACQIHVYGIRAKCFCKSGNRGKKRERESGFSDTTCVLIRIRGDSGMPNIEYESRDGNYCGSGLVPYAYRGGNPYKRACIAAERDWVTMAAFGAMATPLVELPEERGRGSYFPLLWLALVNSALVRARSQSTLEYRGEIFVYSANTTRTRLQIGVTSHQLPLPISA